MKPNRLNILLCLILFFKICFAGTTGKISGTVTDATGEPLIGASVLIEGTHLGAASSLDGSFFILQVPPGTYTLKASMVGYTSVIKKNIQIQVDYTTQVNFQLKEGNVEIEEVVVTAERPLVQKDVTAKVSIISSEELTAMPISDFRDAIRYQSGFTDALHLRGGRSNQIGYMVDGLEITNPLSNSYGPQSDRSGSLSQAANQLYGDQYISDPNSSNYDGISLDKGNVAEAQVLTGTFNAEYGRAMSGIVNIVTKDPGTAYSFNLEYISPMINKSIYRQRDAVAVDDNPGPNDSLKYESVKLQDKFSQWDRKLLGQFRGKINGAFPFIPNLTFLASFSSLNEDSYLPFGFNINRDYFEKLYFNPAGTNFKFSLTGIQGRKNWQPYIHDWKYIPDHYSQFERNSDHYYLEFTHLLSLSTFYTIKVSRLQTTFKRNVPGLKLVINENDYPNYEPIITDYVQPVRWSNGFFYRGYDGNIEDSKTISYQIKLDFSSQINKSHLVKAGVDLLQHDIHYFSYKNPWPGAVHEFQNYVRTPLEFAAYAQDKIELGYFIINVGLRMDYFNPNGLWDGSRQASGPNYSYDNTFATMFPDIYLPGYVDENGDFQYYPEKKVEKQVYFSPRIGISHPVSENLMFRFSYGHFIQRPDFTEIFYTHDIQRNIPLAGNPAAFIQKTVSFEAGLNQSFADLVSVDLSFYYRDIYDQLGTQFINFFPYIYAVVNNSSYANTRGFEVSIYKRYSSNFSANLNYTFLKAEGNENEPRTTVQRYYGTTNNRLRPRRAFPLEWDRTHTISGNINFWIPEIKNPSNIASSIFSGFGANVLFQLASGLPYTPSERAQGDWAYWLRILQTNSDRRPWTYSIDLDLYKNFYLGDFELSLFARVVNLLNTDNVLYVFTNTGRVWDAGPNSSLSEDYQRDPNAKGPPRQIRLGISLKY